MTVTTLRPDATTINTGALTGGASAHAVLADDSDASYVTFDPGEGFSLGVANLSEPAGSVVKSLAIRARGVLPSPGGLPTLNLTEPVAIANSAWKTTLMTFTIQPAIPWSIDPDIMKLTGSVAGSSPAIRLIALYVDVTYVEKPELTVDAPTSTIDDANAPLVGWTLNLDSDGGAQTHYEIAVVADGDDPDADPIIVGSGVLAGSTTAWQLDEPLPDGTYDCYVRIAQTVNSAQHWSDWEKSDFIIDVLLPAEPSFTLVPETSDGRMRLDIEEGSGGDATTDMFEVQASDDGGETWRTLRTVAGWGLVEPDAGSAMAWDREGANGQEVVYRVRAGHDYSGSFAWSAWVDETGMWGPTRTCWLKHPLDAAQDLAVRIDAYGESSIAARQSQMHPLGRSSVIIAADKHGPETGAVTFLTPDQESRDALKTLLRANPATPLLLQVGAADKRPDRWAIFGQIDTAYIVDKSWIDDTRETLGWIEVQRP